MTLPIIAGAHLVLLFAIIDPMQQFNLDVTQLLVLTGIVAALGFYGAFVERERPVDERDATHRAFAGRAAFHVGAAALTIGIAFQIYRQDLDPWLVFALVAMIIAKTGARYYSDARL
jgi:hypothetical protein